MSYFRAAAASDHAAQDFADSVGDEITNYLSRFAILSVPPRELIRQGVHVEEAKRILREFFLGTETIE